MARSTNFVFFFLPAFFLFPSINASSCDMRQRHMFHDDSAVTIFFGLTVLASPDDHHADLAYIDSLPSPGAYACACAPSKSTELMMRLSCLSASLPLAWSLHACRFDHLLLYHCRYAGPRISKGDDGGGAREGPAPCRVAAVGASRAAGRCSRKRAFAFALVRGSSHVLDKDWCCALLLAVCACMRL